MRRLLAGTTWSIGHRLSGVHVRRCIGPARQGVSKVRTAVRALDEQFSAFHFAFACGRFRIQKHFQYCLSVTTAVDLVEEVALLRNVAKAALSSVLLSNAHHRALTKDRNPEKPPSKEEAYELTEAKVPASFPLRGHSLYLSRACLNLQNSVKSKRETKPTSGSDPSSIEPQTLWDIQKGGRHSRTSVIFFWFRLSRLSTLRMHWR